MEPQTPMQRLVKRALPGDIEALPFCKIGNHKFVPRIKVFLLMVIVLTLNKQASLFGSQTAKSRHTGADKWQTPPAHLIPYQRKIPRKESGP